MEMNIKCKRNVLFYVETAEPILINFDRDGEFPISIKMAAIAALMKNIRIDNISTLMCNLQNGVEI